MIIDLTGKLTEGVDAYPVLQWAADSIPLNQPALIRLPAISVNVSRPVIVDKPRVRLAGAGADLTTIGTLGCPVFQFGTPRGAGIPGNWTPSPLGRSAFMSGGNTILQLSNHPLCWGGGNHWSDLAAFTLEIAFVAQGEQIPLFCCGRDFQHPEGPWVEYTPLPNGMGLVQAFWADKLGKVHWTNIVVPPVGLNAVSLVWGAGKLTAQLNGQPVTVNGGTDFAGFARGTGAYPVHIGTRGLAPSDGPAPKFQLHGLKASTAALSPAQLGRWYDNTTPGCLTLFEGIKDAGRGVAFRNGDGSRSYAWAFDTAPNHQFLAGNAISGMSLWGSPAVALGEVCGFKADDVVFRGGAVGLGSMPRGVSYPLNFTRCDFFGSEAGINLAWACNASFDACNVYEGGNTFARFTGCSFSLRDAFLGTCSATARNAIEHYAFTCGGTIAIEDVTVDNEGTPLANAVVYIEDSYALPTSVNVSNLVASQLGPNAAHLHLATGDPNPAKRNTVSATGLSLSGGGGAAAVRVDSPSWKGTVNYAGSLPVTGQGASGVKPQ